jgi:uncharacterized ParB-like nuclease family protein
MLTLVQAQQALQQHANANTISAQQITQMLQNVRGVTFANIAYVSKVATAAAHKLQNVQKVTVANVQLFNNLQAFTDVYTNAVKRTAAHIADNNAADVQGFTKQDNYFAHTPCHSIVQHKTNGKEYLFAIFNSADSMLFINNNVATKQEVAALLTASAAKELLAGSNVVHNKANNVMHTVQVRTIALENIVSVTAAKQSLTV